MTIKISHLFIAALAGSGAFAGASRFSTPGSDIEVVQATRPAAQQDTALTTATDLNANSASSSSTASDSNATSVETSAPDLKAASNSNAGLDPNAAADSSQTPGSKPITNAAAESNATVKPNMAEDPKPVAPSTGAPPSVNRDRIPAVGGGDPFRTATWTPPPPPPPAPVAPPPPPPPAAPPLPFAFVGLLEQKSNKPTAFLAKGEALVVAGVGDVIDGVYRVESLSPTGVVVTYLPLNQRQTVGPSGGTP